jgi:outer membrane protein
MNKNLLWIAAILYVGLSSCGKNAEKKAHESSASSGELLKSEIAYVQIDTLLSKYEFYKEVQETMLKKKQMLESELNKQAGQFQKKAVDFQEKVQRQLLTSRQAEEMQQQLGQEQQGLSLLKDKMSYQLMGDEQIMNRQIYDSIQSYLKEFNKRHSYKMILTSASGSPVLWADKGLDITDSLVVGLNSRYKGKK